MLCNLLLNLSWVCSTLGCYDTFNLVLVLLDSGLEDVDLVASLFTKTNGHKAS